jgi:hypothetical protein
MRNSKSLKLDGCWTCKLRRKKCNGARPACGDCDSLEIVCVYGPKPTWMKGDEEQRKKTILLKDEIKRNAAYRREKAGRPHISAQYTTTSPFNIISGMTGNDTVVSSKPLDSPVPDECDLGPARSLPVLHENSQQLHTPIGLGYTPAIETDFISRYLDFVFPSLFPFYRPSFLDTSRGWLHDLLGKSKVAYHSAVSLTSYFITIALADIDSDPDRIDCKQLRWNNVEQETDKCFDSLRTNVTTLNTNLQPTRSEKVETLGSVVQIIVAEMALGNSSPWETHLPPAFALFEDIMVSSTRSAEVQEQSTFTSILLEIGPTLWTSPEQGKHIWSPQQAGFRFLAGLLIFIDVVASTALQKAPRLLAYHGDVLASTDDGMSVHNEAEVRLSGLVGCRNDVVRVIAEIAALDAWKEQCIDTNSFIIADLFERASGIANRVARSIEFIQNASVAPFDGNHRAPFDMSPDPSASSTSTLIWAHAAQLYLEVVVHGWRLCKPGIRANVAQIIGLCGKIPTYQYRALAWPLCVAGCLTLESDEASFMALFSDLDKVYTVGALEDARQIVEKVWQNRSIVDYTTWDLASCFSILGSPILLV